MNSSLRHFRVGYWFIGLILSLGSCISSKELVLYQKGVADKDTIVAANRYIPKIKSGDVLSVQVSSLSAEATALFNPYATIAAMGGAQQGSTTSLPYTPGYLVNEEGQIELPIIGKVMVQGLTNMQAAGQIRQKLLEYLKEPVVNVRNTNFQITVTGEVARPAMFSIPNEQITLPAALGMAGDITIYGKRTNILVIREENGQRTFNQIDLTNRDVFKSPYFYLRPNDIVYVEPGKVRVASADRTNQIIPLVLSALSIIALALSRTVLR
ncbi:polysaccharide export outer membrane protein [Larkinella arboricola]|uniref:Polysaccharide export outer membrane protein n=1 Tax=Larkinella arboricola TaxID=643671 RepID=A0A327WUI0_LARAB|nr:polysaccharide biosynthesis/export family protein [Larkinella arboricola]RAJ96080.1 polysaccharide export outer membrane protein [Larkinella arboricola]